MAVDGGILCVIQQTDDKQGTVYKADDYSDAVGKQEVGCKGNNDNDTDSVDQQRTSYEYLIIILRNRKMAEKKEATTRFANQIRVLDEATRHRRKKRQLENLEKDNFQEDPHASFAHLIGKHKLPAFSDSNEDKGPKRRRKNKSTADHFKQRFRKTFQSLLEELPPEAHNTPSYFTAAVPPSKLPQRHFCAVCGFPSPYTCVTCGARYCSSNCLSTHKDTRCLKWTA